MAERAAGAGKRPPPPWPPEFHHGGDVSVTAGSAHPFYFPPAPVLPQTLVRRRKGGPGPSFQCPPSATVTREDPARLPLLTGGGRGAEGLLPDALGVISQGLTSSAPLLPEWNGRHNECSVRPSVRPEQSLVGGQSQLSLGVTAVTRCHTQSPGLNTILGKAAVGASPRENKVGL